MVILCLPALDHLHPFRVLGGLDLGQHGVQHIGCIAHDGKIHIHVLAQFAGVNIDLDDGSVFGKGLGVQRHAVGKAGAHRDEHVALCHRPVGGVAAVHPQHAQIHRVTVGHNACGHQGVGGGDLRLVQQIPQRLAAGCAAHAAAKVHQRTLCGVDEIGRPVHLLFIIGSHGADGLRLLGGELAHRCGHVLGDIHQHRALAAALRNAESCPHGVSQVLYPAHREVMLCDGHCDALDVRFLKAVLANAAGGHVAGKGHHGH